MMELRPYQHEAVGSLYAHLRARDDNPCVVIPTAGGKTPVMAFICKDAVGLWNGRVLILAHVKELLEQTAGKLNAICPEVRFGVYSAGLNRRDTANPVIVAGIQSVYKRACELDAFDLVVIDECCPTGTLVATPTGPVPIEMIRAGDLVLNALGVGEVLATSARTACNLVALEFSDGTQLTCTAGHPIFTERGWVAAGFMELGTVAFSVEDLRVLRTRVSPLEQDAGQWSDSGHERAPLGTAAFLLEILLQEAQQSDGHSVHTEQSQRALAGAGASTGCSGREWTAPARTAKGTSLDAGTVMDSGVRGPHEDAESIGLADALQDRPGEPGDLRGHRDRRSLPRCHHPTGTGSPEDDLPGEKRLVRVTHHQRPCPVVVHNLHVAGHPSFFADGVLVHNCHLIPEEGDGMYRQFLAEAKVVNPNLRIIGFTATPFRMKTGPICTPDGFLNHICYEVGVRELIVQGYLCPLVTKAGINKADFTRLHVRAGEFVADEVEDLMDDDRLVEAACGETVGYTGDRKAVLIFASGIKHGEHIVRVLKEKHGIHCGFVTGETPSGERDALLDQFRAGRLKYLCNVNVLTTGFDAPNIDCVALIRPTLSAGLYYQMVGRGFRLHPSKQNCLVLDFGGNVLRHGPVDQIHVKEYGGNGTGPAPAKECPECHAVVAAGYARCPECGFEFPPPERTKHEARASVAGILSGQVTTTKCAVRDIFYSVHTKRGAGPDAPRSMRVDYKVGFNDFKSEWICFEHDGYARQKAMHWWRRRSKEPVPETAEEAVALAQGGRLALTREITVRTMTGDDFDRITGYELGDIPPALDDQDLPADALDFPFGYNAVAAEEEIPW